MFAGATWMLNQACEALVLHFAIINNLKNNSCSSCSLNLPKLLNFWSPHTGRWSGVDGSPTSSGDSGGDRLVLSGSTPLFIPVLPLFWHKHPGEDHVPTPCPEWRVAQKVLLWPWLPSPWRWKGISNCLLLTDLPYHQMAWKSLKLSTVTNASLVMFHFFYLTILSINFLTVK